MSQTWAHRERSKPEDDHEQLHHDKAIQYATSLDCKRVEAAAMRVVVTGATGNVGSRVVAALIADPQVRSVVGVARRVPNVELPKVEWVELDVGSDPLTSVLAGADAVVHLAWLIQPVRDPELLRRVNVGGTRRVIETAVHCEVPVVVYASSIGVYAPDGTGIARNESWPHTGIPSSIYSRHKAEAESFLDTVDAGSTRIVRLRMALVFQRHAASEIVRYFLGPLAPAGLIGRRGLPIFPELEGVQLQVVHAADAARAYVAALHHSDATGAFNIAAEPVLTTNDLASIFGARSVRVPKGLIRAGAAATFALRLQPTSPGWVDLAFGAPIMDIAAAHRDLGWREFNHASKVVSELRDGFGEGAGTVTAPLRAKRRHLSFPTATDRNRP